MTSGALTAGARIPPLRLRPLAPLALFLGAAAASMLMSQSVSLWTDEAITLSAAARTPDQLWALVQRIDAVHGVYYAFMNGWTHLFGVSPFSVRLPSALAAGGTAVAVLMLTRRICDPGTAWIAGAVCATLPRITWGGIEARPFIFSALAAAWGTYLLVRAIERPSFFAWLWYGVLAGVGIAVNIYVLLVVVGHLVTVIALAPARRVIAGFVIAAIGAVGATLPVILLSRSQQSQLGGLGDRDALSIARKVLVNQIFLGETPADQSAPAWFTRSWQVSAIVASLLGVAAIIAAILRPALRTHRKRELMAVAVPWLVVPTAFVAGYAVLIAPIYQPRYLTLTAPAAAMLIAAGIRTIRTRWIVIAWALVYSVSIIVVFASQRIPFAKSGSDWSAAASVVASSSRAGDVVYFAPRDTNGVNGEARLTSRRIAYAYPTAFDDLADLTLDRTGAETATLDGYSRGLDDVLPALDSKSTVWALYAKNGPASVETEADGRFRALDYRATTVWDGPLTTVVEYSPNG